MASAGAIGGLVGSHLVLGETYRYIDADMIAQTGFAWTGLMVSLLAANRPVAILLAGFFFAGLQIGGFAMESHEGLLAVGRDDPGARHRRRRQPVGPDVAAAAQAR